MHALHNKRILIGLTGGIAAYKIPQLVRDLKAGGAEVKVVMTQSAKAFITPMTLQAVSGEPVHDDLFDPSQEAAMGHIALARWADCILVAPASANSIAQFVHGQACDLLSTLWLVSSAMKCIAPAMNRLMWEAPATRRNIAQLKQDGVHVLGPDEGEQACGEIGLGRLREPEALLTALTQLFSPNLFSGQHIVMTAGPTQEALDPVRFMSNHSSGKMGFALAAAAASAGAKVTLIAGPVALATPENVTRIDVVSAQQMHDAVLQCALQADIFIGTAAVADYTPVETAPHKLKKQAESLTFTFVKTPDILAKVSQLTPKPFMVGFAAETECVREHALKKWRDKQLDLLFANEVSDAHNPFYHDENQLHAFWGESESEYQFFPLQPKPQLAQQILTLIATCYTKSVARCL